MLVKVQMLLLPLLAVEAKVALEPGWSNETTGAVDEGYHAHDAMMADLDVSGERMSVRP